MIRDIMNIENVYGEIILLAHGGGGEVHHFKSKVVDFVIGNLAELSSCGVFLGVGSVDTIDTGTFEHHVGFNLNTAE